MRPHVGIVRAILLEMLNGINKKDISKWQKLIEKRNPLKLLVRENLTLNLMYPDLVFLLNTFPIGSDLYYFTLANFRLFYYG